VPAAFYGMLAKIFMGPPWSLQERNTWQDTKGLAVWTLAGQHDTDRGSTLVKICDLWEFSIIQHMKVLDFQWDLPLPITVVVVVTSSSTS